MPTTSVDVSNLLLGLAWMGELDRRQIQRLWFGGKSESTIEKTLARLAKDDLITKRAWSIYDEQRKVTAPQLARWSLTQAGHALVKASAQYPAKPVQVRQQRLIAHDARTTETIVRLIEIGRRSNLSGIFVGHELRLDPHERRPVCDALVVMQFGDFDRPNVVPWSSDPGIDDEGMIRFAIEADNGTEPLGVIAAKARAYRSLAESDVWAEWWMSQYGPLPIPLWVAPSEERAFAIHEQWKCMWHSGRWIIASDEGLRRNTMRSWRKRCEKTIALGFNAYRPQLPEPPPPATLPQPEPPSPAQPQTAEPAPQLATTPETPPAAPAPRAAVTTTLRATPRVIVLQPGPPPSPPAIEQRRQSGVDWVDLIWTVLTWLGRLVFALVRLPVRLVYAIGVWYVEQNDSTDGALVRLTLATLLVAAPAYVWVAQPAWLLDPLQAAAAAVVPATPSAADEPLAPPIAAPIVCPLARVTADRVNLRAEPGLHGAVLGKLRRGEVVKVLDCQGYEVDGFTWWKVAGVDGKAGWAATRWLEAQQ